MLYLPQYPSAESNEEQEEQRLKILSEFKKKEKETVSKLMSKTFAHRGHDVVRLQLSIKEIKERWPALYVTGKKTKLNYSLMQMHLGHLVQN